MHVSEDDCGINLLSKHFDCDYLFPEKDFAAPIGRAKKEGLSTARQRQQQLTAA
jgi:hypothetical protein